jgi:hypothetical protein
MKLVTLNFEKNWDNAICVLADQVSFSSQNSNILGSAHSEAHEAAPCSSCFHSSAFCAWNLHFVRNGLSVVLGFMHRATEL